MKTFFSLLVLIWSGGAWLHAGDTLRITAEPDQSCLLAGSDTEVVVKIDLTAAANPRHKRSPLNIAVVLDRSGSMAGAKIEKARQAASMLVDQLAPGDIFSLVAFDSTVEVIVPAQPIEDRDGIKERIGRIRPRNNTAIYAGVEAGAKELRRFFSNKRINRILLLSDGLANVGPSSPQALRGLGEHLAGDGISVSTIGVGDDYNEDLMSALAEASDANYYYVKDTEKLPQIFARELGSLLSVAAREIRIEVVCPKGVRPLGFLGRPEKFEDQRAIVRLDSLAAGQNRSILLRCRPSATHSGSAAELARVKIHYTDELADGRESSAAETVNISFTDNPTRAKSSQNAGVIAQRELMLNATRTDEAIAQADAGNYKEAARRLSDQAAKLDSVYAVAPMAQQPQIRQEAQRLREISEQISQGNYGAGSRKNLQEQSWNARNSKQ